MKNHLKEKQSGQSLLEYALILVLATLAAVLSLWVFGLSVQDLYCTTIGALRSDETICTSGTIIMHETFDRMDDREDIYWLGNGWEGEDGQLQATQSGEHRMLLGEDEWEDYTVTVSTADLHQGNGYGVYFRTSGEPDINGYVFQYDPGYGNGAFLIRKLVDGRESPPIARINSPEDFNWYDQQREISVSAEGDTFVVSMDGEELMTATDDTYQSGRVGLRTWDSSRATFDDLVVTR